jgi:DNA-directed RNA polymerase alpha subunit
MAGKPGRPRTHFENPDFAFWKGEGLSTRVANALAKRKVDSWQSLVEYGLNEIAAFPNLGPRSLQEIEEAAQKAGIRLESIRLAHQTNQSNEGGKS